MRPRNDANTGSILYSVGPVLGAYVFLWPLAAGSVWKQTCECVPMSLVTKQDQLLVVYVSAPPDEAAELARSLVDARLAACVNLVPQMRSIYSWKGEIADENETLLVIKTHAAHFDRLADLVQNSHSYDVPEIIALPIERASSAYEAWLRDCIDRPLESHR